MWIIGLTGALGAGKSTLAAHSQTLGIPVHCADRSIHRILSSEREVIHHIQALWPTVIRGAQVDRGRLGDVMMTSPGALRTLETLLYPKLLSCQKTFLETHAGQGRSLVVLDVPLLLEVGLAPYCHSIILAVASKDLRETRVLGRPGRMTREKFEFFEVNRMPDEARYAYVHTLISTGREEQDPLRILEQTLEKFSKETSPPWEGRWPSRLERQTW